MGGQIPDKIVAPVPSLIAGQAVFTVKPRTLQRLPILNLLSEASLSGLNWALRRSCKFVAGGVKFHHCLQITMHIRDSGLYSPACSSGVAVELSHGRLRWMPMLASTIFC